MSFEIAPSYPYYLANRPVQANQDLPVVDKYSGKTISHAALADEKTFLSAISQAQQAALPFKKMPSYQRQMILEHCVKRLSERSEELAYLVCLEAGKPIKDSRGEVQRLIHTFKVAGEEAVRRDGEVLTLDRIPAAQGYIGFWKPVPIGPCAFITPFNFPLNLVAHKIAPALAVGCPFVLKPSPLTPLSSLVIGEILSETNLPLGSFSILPAHPEAAGPLIVDERIKLLSFTGSTIGWKLKEKAGKKKVLLELGGNAACVVDETVSTLDDAISRLIVGAFYQSGQSCISVQKIYIHQSKYEEVKGKLIEKASSLKSGDPKDESVFLGPLISEKEALRLEGWIQEALRRGANLLCGGIRKGNLMEATLLEKVPQDLPLCKEEAFGPVAILYPFEDFGKVLEEINQSAYGLQAGIFTRDLFRMHQAWDTLEVGGVMINEIPSWRVDHMPYGGTKDSGVGREGVRFAIAEMSEPKLLVVRGV